MSLRLLTAILSFSFVAHFAIAQVLVNGQTFTNGLSIINSPSPNTPFHAGSNIPISIEVSGNGKLPLSATTPGSELDSGYDSLEIYLVSATVNINVTVSEGPGLLTGETGSVRHLNWPLPSCVPAGQYNLTFYEASQFERETLFAITPILVTIENASSSEKCTNGTNQLESQPQPSSPLPSSPFLQNNINPSLTITLSGNNIFPTASPVSTSITLVVVTVGTTTDTTGENALTTAFTSTWTTTAALGTQDLSGFLPVNASSAIVSRMVWLPVSFIAGIWVAMQLLEIIIF
ncbi:hypothetical protein BDQ17DRAFT_1340823 [Cyathus striatus]|nr:hypothetical protein BDQ17DRAFT_1340823 [Cyathus striatus]